MTPYKKKIFPFLFFLGVFLSIYLPLFSAKSALRLKDPKILSMPIHDNGEEMVNMKKEGGIAVGPPAETPDNNNYYFVRRTLYHKLLEAEKSLPPGKHLALYEGYRSPQLQKKLFEKRMRYLQKKHPNWSYQHLFLSTCQLIAPMKTLLGTPNVPSHTTGGAVDLYLIDDHGKPLPMGIHPRDWMLDETGELSATNSRWISAQERHNRLIMNRALQKTGMENIDNEYWHWSYGDRYWANRHHRSDAFYGPVHQRELHRR